MKDAVKPAIHVKSGSRFISAAVKQLLAFAAALIASGAKIGSGLTPFGTAFTAAAPPVLLPAAFLGSTTGYLLIGFSASAFKYIAASAAAAAIKLIICKLCRLKREDFWSFITASLLTFLTGAVTGGSNIVSLAVCLCEALASGAAAYFTCSAFGIISRRGGDMTSKDRLSAAVVICVVCTGLYGIRFGILSVGCTVSALLLAASSEYGSVTGGTVSGALAGIAAFFATGNTFPALSFTIAGIAGGAVGTMGKAAVSSALTLAAISSAAFGGFSDNSTVLLTSFTAGCLIYVVLPSRLTSAAAILFRRPPENDGVPGMRDMISSRLTFTSEALVTVGNMISDVSDRLAASETPSFDKVLSDVMSGACAGCSYISLCWNSEREQTSKTLRQLAESDGSFCDERGSYSARCPRKERVETVLVRSYSEFLRNSDADMRVKEIRSVIKDQYHGLSELLRDLSDEFSGCESYSGELSSALADAVSSTGLRVSRLSCITDKYGRMKIEMRIISVSDLPVSRAKLKSIAEGICKRNFDVPEMTRGDRSFLVTMTEKAKFDPEIGIYRITGDNSEVSGDTADSFTDGKGRKYLVISDGMGSGKRAAADSSMTGGLFCRMMCSGFGAECSLKLINSALMYRSYDESLATLDVSEIDLYTGKVTMFKAGTAPTIVLKKGHASKASCRTLPIGILKNVGFDKAIAELKSGDILLMMSDGATFEGTDWICRELEAFDGESAAELCERIAKKAKAIRKDGHSDDITVMAAIMADAV